MLPKISKYWWYQLCGWFVFALVSLFFAYNYGYPISEKLLFKLFLLVALGIAATHSLRLVIIRRNWLSLPMEKVVPRLLVCLVITSFIFTFLLLSLTEILGLSENDKKLSFLNRLLFRSIDNTSFLMLWVLIYYAYHYFQKIRRQEVDTLRLQSLVKELELKTIKSHINPHFIFNSLNSIRALVDENPIRARNAITELSNILRSSMQAEMLETVSLEKELNIVKDYLALEQMRFEERLKVDFEIDEDTLDQPIPPMMLQTLVENAIKHGISKQINGGTVKIISDFTDHNHEIIIRNSGYLNGSMSSHGFGLQSTRDRLSLLFGEKAKFEIKEIGGNMVEAKVILPIESK